MKSEGACTFCRKVCSGTTMTRHLQSCEKRVGMNEAEVKKGRLYLIRASAGPFWMYFEVGATSKLEEIDSFLRDRWLECCGHLSSFKINDTTYSSEPDSEFEDKSMNIQLSKILQPGTVMDHEYDFGTTTYLKVTCISEREGTPPKRIGLIASNNLPEFNCQKCKKHASNICPQCIFEGNGLLCSSCAKKHECGEDMLLPVLNSPRMGMCGYTGPC